MLADSGVGVIVFSVDTEMDLDLPIIHDAGRLADTCARLVGLFDRYRLSATWGIADPAHSAVSRMFRSSNRGHEMAILGDRTWIGPEVGRRRFARELARRVSDARLLGEPVSTLALQNVALSGNHDLLVKHHISMIRPGNKTTPGSVRSGPLKLRYGVWQLPPTVELPGQSSWLSVGGRLAVRRVLRNAIYTGGVVHFVVNVARLVEKPDTGFRLLDQLLSDAADARRKKLLCSFTLRAFATQLKTRPVKIAAQSILRKAA